MHKKLSKKERGEVVTKGYLEDQNYVTKGWIQDQNYVTKDWIKEQNYVTKDWAQDMFEKFEENMAQHTKALMEFHHHENQLIVEALISRIERVERHVGLLSF